MTQADFKKKRFKGFEIIQYKTRSGKVVDCCLLAVDFENELFKLIPIPDSNYEENEFWARCENCDRPKREYLKGLKMEKV